MRNPVVDAIGVASALGGNLSLLGSPGNLIAQSALEQVSSASFFEYAKLGIPCCFAGSSTFDHRL